MLYEFISFLKKYNIYDEEVFNSFFRDAFMFDYEDNCDFSECVYDVDERNVLIRIKACIPKMIDYRTILINIHEYVHYYTLYRKLGKELKVEIDCEVLPMLYERIFVMEKDNGDLYNYWNSLRNSVLKNDNKYYVYALDVQDDLLDVYYKGNKIKEKKYNN